MKQIYFTRISFFLAFAMIGLSLSAQVYVKHDATGNSDGTSWTNAYESVEKALANVTSGEIWIAAGTYRPGGTNPNANSVFSISGNIAMYGGFNGTETDLSQRNPATNLTILSGDINGNDIQNNFASNKSDNTKHVVYVDSMLTAVTIDGFSIIGGHTLDDSALDVYERAGGGIYALSPISVNRCDFYNNFGRTGASMYLPDEASGSSVTNSTFRWNSTTSQSAGIFISEADGFTMTGCTFSNNQTVRGALYALRSNNINLDDCTFTLNTNIVGPGAAMWNFGCTNVAISNSTFSNNKAPNSGAIYFTGTDLMNTEGPDNFVLTSCIFSDNEATSGIGGAFRNVNGSYTLDDCIFSGNTATSSGGHVRNDTDGDEVVYKNCLFEDAVSGGWGGAHTCYGDGNFTMTNCEYINNTASNYGGAANCGLGVGNVMFDNCTFSGNSSSSSSGGAVYVQNDSINLTILNSIFENNSSQNDGGAIGVFASQTTVIENCDFLFNTSTDFGGAINLFEDSVDIANLSVLNSTFILNQAGNQGGAISTGDADASFVSCLFGENLTMGNSTGGALSLNASDSNTVDVSILHCTIGKNSAILGAGIAQWTGTSEAYLNTTIQNTILFNEDGDNYAIEDGTPSLVSNGGNMSNDQSLNSIFTEPSDLNEVEPDLVDPDGFDYNLTTSSAGIDAGVAAGAPEYDILGNPRINQPDMGAYENQDVTGTNEAIIENNGMLAVSPNPVRANVTMATLTNDWTGELNVRLTNIKGQVVNEMKIQKANGEFRFELPLQNIEKGIYQVSVSNGEKMVVDRLIRL